MDDRLQKFARLVEIGNFTKAARELHISQPALTIAINKLEQELGTELLIRANRKLELTESGRAAYQSALEHQSISEQLRNNLTRIAKRRPAVSIGMTDSVAAVLCETTAFGQLESVADVTIVVNNSRYLRDSIERRQLDIAFIIDDESGHPNLEVDVAGTEELVLVCHPKLLLATSESLRRGKLNNFICYDKPSTTYRHIQQRLQLQAIKAHIILFSTSPDVMLRMVLRGRGSAVLPRQMVGPLLHSGQLSQVTLHKKPLVIERPLCSIKLPGKSLPECLRTFKTQVTSGE